MNLLKLKSHSSHSFKVSQSKSNEKWIQYVGMLKLEVRWLYSTVCIPNHLHLLLNIRLQCLKIFSWHTANILWVFQPVCENTAFYFVAGGCYVTQCGSMAFLSYFWNQTFLYVTRRDWNKSGSIIFSSLPANNISACNWCLADWEMWEQQVPLVQQAKSYSSSTNVKLFWQPSR